jgi:hypothetical protein
MNIHREPVDRELDTLALDSLLLVLPPYWIVAKAMTSTRFSGSERPPFLTIVPGRRSAILGNVT